MHPVILLKKRKRAINFTETDKKVLLDLIQPHVQVIENKRTDKFTSKLKSETWENIKNQYNKLNTQPRTALQLKLFYESNKYKLKKKNDDSDVEGSSNKIVKIEVETSSIMDILAKNKNFQNSDEPKNQKDQKCIAVSKIKLVDLKQLQQPEIANVAKTEQSILTQKENYSQTDDENCSPAGSCDGASLDAVISPEMQRDLYNTQMQILQDERDFRRLEHVKRMEYLNLNILALKTQILQQS